MLKIRILKNLGLGMIITYLTKLSSSVLWMVARLPGSPGQAGLLNREVQVVFASPTVEVSVSR